MFGCSSQKLDKTLSIKRLKALGAMTFDGTTNLADAKKWLRLIKKCFGVMNCPKERNKKCKIVLKVGGSFTRREQPE